MEVLEFPNGICDKHGPRLNVNGIPRCIKCVAEAERASRPPAPVVSVEDPGHEAMMRGGFVPDPSAAPKPGVTSTPNGKMVNVAHLVTLQEIRQAIYGLPMPGSLAQYKRLKKIQDLIDQAVKEEENG